MKVVKTMCIYIVMQSFGLIRRRGGGRRPNLKEGSGGQIHSVETKRKSSVDAKEMNKKQLQHSET